MKHMIYLVLILFLGACNHSERAQQASAIRHVQRLKEANCFSDSAYYKDLSFGDYRFQVSASTQNDNNQLYVLASQNGILLNDIHQFINEVVVDTLLADLNNNQIPELLVVTESLVDKQKKVWGYEYINEALFTFSLKASPSSNQDNDFYTVEHNQLVHQIGEGKTASRELFSLDLFHQLTLISAS